MLDIGIENGYSVLDASKAGKDDSRFAVKSLFILLLISFVFVKF